MPLDARLRERLERELGVVDDHGTAGPVFVLGPRVVGGLYGEQPSLTDLDHGDLRATMDFRAVFATVLASVLRADPARYIEGDRWSALPFIPPD